MPLDPISLTPIFTSALLASGEIGIGTPQLALGLATGLSIYAHSGIIVISTDVGLLGAGVGVGAGVIIPPTQLLNALVPLMASGLIVGPFSPVTASAIALGMSMALLTAGIITVNAGVGVGAGKVQLIPNPAVSVPTFIQAFASVGMTGIMSPSLATAVALALDICLPTGIAVVGIVGAAGPLPGAGAGVGSLL